MDPDCRDWGQEPQFAPNCHKEVKRGMATGGNRIDIGKCKRGMRAGYAQCRGCRDRFKGNSST